MRVADQLDVEVQYGSQKCTLPLVVVAGKGPTLLVRDWLQYILNWTGRLLALQLSIRDRPGLSLYFSATVKYLVSHLPQCIILQPSFRFDQE